MNLLNRMKIGARLGAGFALILVALCFLGATALYQASHIYSGTQEIAEDWLPSVELLGQIQTLAEDARRTTLRSMIEIDPQRKLAQRAAHEDTLRNIDAVLQSYAKVVTSPEEQQLYDDIKKALTDSAAADRELLELSEAGTASVDKARALANGRSADLATGARSLIEKDLKLNSDGAAHETANAAASYRTAMWMTAIVIGTALFLGAVIAVVITRSITVPIRRSVAIAENVAAGDLTSIIEISGADETSLLLAALSNMNERLKDVVGKVRTGSESIASGSSEIAAGNTDLSQRTEEQAASLEETAASMEQLTATVKQNTENARQGNTLAVSASDTAIKGGAVVERVVSTMQGIADSSEKVAQIISVIEGIAFQTNILALNAAVEAARAGEQGRGFAVVAGEVRTLAQRSANAAKEIKDLIGESVDRVTVGTRLVNEAGDTMKAVVASVKRVTDLMGEIAAASTEQQTGIEQVNQAVIQMDEVTQQNAALVEQASAAAQSMAVQSSSLREVVSVFKLGPNEATQPDALVLNPKSAVVNPTRKVKSAVSRPAAPRSGVAADWQFL